MRGKTIKQIIAPALCLAVLLTGCGGADASASGEDLPSAGSLPAESVSAAEPEEPPYTGPLYAVNIEDICDSLPDFRGFNIDTQNEITEEYKARYMLMGEMIESLGDYRSEDFRPLYDPDDKEAQAAARARLEELEELVYNAPDAQTQAKHRTKMYQFEAAFYSGLSPADALHTSDIFLHAYCNAGDFVLYKKPFDQENLQFDRNDLWDPDYLTNSELRQFPELDKLMFLGAMHGRGVFTLSEEEQHFLIADSDGKTLYTSPDNIVIQTDGFYSKYRLNNFGADGMLVVLNTDTDRCGYLNIDDFSLIELDETYSLRDYTREGERVRGASNSDLFSEGRVPVVFAESTDTLFHIMGQNGETDFDAYSAECDVAGYLDKSGTFALKFSELPQFEDQIIVRASSYYDGTAIIVARPRARTSGASVHRHDLYAGTYYEIDTEGNILRECTEDTWWEHGEKGNVNGRIRSRSRVEHPEVIPTDRLLLRDDLVLYKNQAEQRYELLDANGNIYPLEAPENVLLVRVLGNGMVLLCCGTPLQEWQGMSEFDLTMRSPIQSIYYVRIEDIRPQDFTANTTDFEPDTVKVSDYDLPE